MQGKSQSARKVLTYLLSLEEGKNEFFLAMAKALIPDYEAMEIVVDKKRLQDELILLQFYRDEKTYRSLVEMISLIGLLNRDQNVAMREIISGYEVIFKKQPSSKEVVSLLIIYALISNRNVKETLIDYNREIDDKANIIEFQRAKASQIISLESEDFRKSVFSEFYKSKELIDSEILKLKNIEEIYLNEEIIELSDSKKIIMDFLMKIRNFKVNRHFYSDYVDPYTLIKLEEGMELKFPILGYIKIKSKTLEQDILLIELEGRSRNYSFRFKKK